MKVFLLSLINFMNYFKYFIYIHIAIYLCLPEKFRKIHDRICENIVLTFNYGMNRVYPNLLKKKIRVRGTAVVAADVVQVVEAKASAMQKL